MVPYRILRSSRRTLALQILPDGGVVVRCPRRLPEEDIRAFVESKEGWLRKHLAQLPEPQPRLTKQELQAMAQLARTDLLLRLDTFALRLGVTFQKVTVRAQRTRWGSCSSKGTISLNCLLMLAPPQVRDYVAVHELCHLMEMNHSPAFWRLVASVLPDFSQSRQWLEKQGPALMSRLPVTPSE